MSRSGYSAQTFFMWKLPLSNSLLSFSSLESSAAITFQWFFLSSGYWSSKFSTTFRLRSDNKLDLVLKIFLKIVLNLLWLLHLLHCSCCSQGWIRSSNPNLLLTVDHEGGFQLCLHTLDSRRLDPLLARRQTGCCWPRRWARCHWACSSTPGCRCFAPRSPCHGTASRSPAGPWCCPPPPPSQPLILPVQKNLKLTKKKHKFIF